MKKIKKFASLLLTLLLVAGLFQTGAYAHDGAFQFTVSSGGSARTVSYFASRNAYLVVVPSDATSINIVRDSNGTPQYIKGKSNKGVAITSELATQKNCKSWTGASYDGATSTFTIPLDTYLKDATSYVSLLGLSSTATYGYVTLYSNNANGDQCDLILQKGGDPGNFPPEIIWSVTKTQTMYIARNATFTVNMSGVFADPEGVVLAYKYSTDGTTYTAFSGSTYTGTYSGTPTVLYFKANDGQNDSNANNVYTVHLETLTDKTGLQSAISSATALVGANYYTSGDRYNGKDSSASGFWSDMQSALTAANSINSSSTVSQEDVDNAANVLDAAITKLISRQNVNLTGLYDIYRTANAKYTDTQTKSSDYTALSWNRFKTALQNAQELMDALYNQDGSPSDRNIGPDSAVSPEPSDAIHQSDMDAAAASLTSAYDSLLQIYDVNQGIFWQRNVSAMLTQFKAAYDKPMAYETTSFTTFKTAYDSAQSFLTLNGAITEASAKTAVDGYQVQAKALWESYYTGLKSAGSSINVSFRVADNRALNSNPAYVLDPKEGTYYNSHVTLSGGFTLQNLVDTAGLSLNSQGDGDSNMYEWLVYLNGVLMRPADQSADQNVLSINKKQVSDVVDWTDLLLRDGDQVVLLLAPSPTSSYYGHLNTAAFDKTITYIGVLQFGNHASSVKEGGDITLNVSRVSGFQATYDGTSTPFSGAYVLAARLDGSGNPTSYRTLDGVTDAQGNVTTKIYEAGEYVLVAFNPVVDTDNYMYPSLAAAARTTVTVTSLDGAALTAAKAEQIALLDGFLASCDQVAIGPAKWAQIQSSYQTGKDNINSAVSLQAARDAQVAAHTAITAIVDEANTANSRAVDLMTHYLSLLPSIEQIDAGLFMQRDVPRMGIAITHFGAMTDYQKAQLTVAQMQQWNALLTAFGTDGSKLPENKSYTVKVNVVGGHAGDFYNASIGYSYYYADASGTIYAPFIRNESISSLSTPYTSTYGLDGEEGIGFNFSMPVTDAFTIDHIEVTGAEYTEISHYMANSTPYTAYGVGFNSNPRSDITITIYTQSGDNIDFIRTSAKSALTTAYQGYSKANYSNARWAELTAAYNAGLAAIGAAADKTAIDSAKASAISAMAAVKTLAQEGQTGSTVGTHGTARVIIENTAYPSSPINGTITDVSVPLNDDSTMMTAALYALDQAGFTWKGTGGSGGSSPRDYTITYLASISKDGETLGEFTGSAKSGWMGTLNDWFVNESFQSFSVYANNKSYLLRDGDEIRIMFTDKYGEDLSGTWGNANTALSGLSVSGGTLTPAFQSDTFGYILAIQSGAVSVTPSAANKNYQVRIYLNETSGDNWYRRGESIPVKPGDTINIGIGDYSWPSMNNQSGNTIAYSGTWYSIKIVSSTNADSVISLISEIPKITYSNYKTVQSKVTLARTAYDALIDTAKGKVTNYAALTNAENQISRYTAIDAVKSLLAAIPAADKLTTADKSKVQAAYDAYSKLDAEQQKYITVGDAKKYNDAVEWLKTQGATDTPPAITGSDKEQGTGTVITPAVTATNGTAAASLNESDLTDAIKEAKENGGTITIAPNITGMANKVTVNVPKASVSSIASETTASLTIETPVGNITLPNAALDSFVTQASGSTVTISLGTVDKATLTVNQQKAVGTSAVYDITVLSGTTHITSFGGSSIAVALPYTLKDGEDSSGVTVWYLDDLGKLQQLTATYDKTTGMASFTTTHLSYYLVGYSSVWTNPFIDVKSTDWFYDAVKYVSQNSLMSGMSATTFEPNTDMTRAMLVTVLYRLEGKPSVTGANAFTDVKNGEWYTDAVIWASTNKIVNGYGGGLFGTSDSVTREQLATILLNYAKYKGYNVTKTAELTVYSDASSVSAWAGTAMNWASAENLITGTTSTTLSPTSSASRAQVATILMRFIENVAK